MKIGVLIVVEVNNTIADLEQKFQKLKEMDIHYCQLSTWESCVWTDENAEKINELCAKYDITISAVWCGWEGPGRNAWNFYDGPYALGLVPPEYRTLRVKNLCDGADFAKKLGVTDVATHMGFIPENPSDPNFPGLCIAIRHVAEHLKANGQYLLFESGQETPITMLRCFERVGTDNLAVNLDTANLILYGKGNPVDALDVIGKYVRNLHAKDGNFPTNGMNLGEEKRLGEGKANFPALIRGLKALGYDSHITIEREISGDEQIRDIIDGKKFLSDIITEVYGEGSVE